MGIQIRLTALILAVALTMNMVALPVKAEEDSAPIETQVTTVLDSNDGATKNPTAQPEASMADEEIPSASEDDLAEIIPEESEDPKDGTNEPPEVDVSDSVTDKENPPATGSAEEKTDLIGGELDGVSDGEKENKTASDEEDIQDMLLIEALSDDDETDLTVASAQLTYTVTSLVEAINSEDNPLEAPLPADATIEIFSGKDMETLSNPKYARYYQYCTLKFTSTDAGYVTSANNYHGLGTADYPFSGTIQLMDGTEGLFYLENPLFQCLSTDAVIPSLRLYLVSNIQYDALFASVVKPGSDTQDWDITIENPDIDDNLEYMLPLIGTIEQSANVRLSLTNNNSSVVILGNPNAGLLCRMLEGSLTLTALTTKPLEIKAIKGHAGGLVGYMGNGSNLTIESINRESINGESINGDLEVNKANAADSDGCAGGLVGYMDGAALDLSTSSRVIVHEVKASGGDAGGLVGHLAGSAAVDAETGETVIQPTTITTDMELVLHGPVTAGDCAGGIAGEAEDVIFSFPAISNYPEMISGVNAGGLFGSYTYSGAGGAFAGGTQSAFGTTTVKGTSNAGGLYGVLRNTSPDGMFTVEPDSLTATIHSDSAGNVGGLIGWYTASNLEASLSIAAASVSTDYSGKSLTLGGLIGQVGDDDSSHSAYIAIGQTAATILKGSATDFGGLIGRLTDSGHMVETTGVVEVTCTLPATDFNNTTSTTCGGLIGDMPSGVLWLGSEVVCNVSIANSNNIYHSRGRILGFRDNTLVVTNQTTWQHNNVTNVNDIGNWGQVLCLGADTTHALTVDPAYHTVTVTDPTLVDGDSYSVGSVADFAKVALGCQLTGKGALAVTSIGNSLNVTVSNNIDLSGTGLTGFQRDYGGLGYSNNAVVYLDIPELAVTIEGSGNTITLPGIQTYVREVSRDEATGKVWRLSHNRQGLISKASNLTVSDLTIAGDINVKAENGSNYHVGALAAEVTGDISLTNVTGSASITCNGHGDNSSAGGLIGARYNGDKVGTISFSYCKWHPESTISITSTRNGIYAGGFIAEVNQSYAKEETGQCLSFTVENCTISGKLDRNAAGVDAWIGGLFGSLKENTAAITNHFRLSINVLTADGLQISAPNATSAGGLLSYEWFYTDAIINGLKVENCTLNTGSSSFGGLVYKASGSWSLQGSGVTIEASNTFRGASSDVEPSGMLVCHAENSSDKSALYLEILQGCYQLDKDVHIDIGGSTCFDEIAGTTFGVKGNGIVSVETDNHLIHKDKTDEYGNPVLVSNTYVNQLTGGNYTNSRSRYYYNLNYFGAGGNGAIAGRTVPSEAIDSPGKMVMFSAHSHCDGGLQGYFYSKPGKISSGGAIDLTGYSYYPANFFAEVNNATIQFAYEEIEGREKTANNKQLSLPTQHFGMHTGLFTGVTNAGKTLNVTKLKLQGNVGGANGNYGALIRDGASGSSSTSMFYLVINGIELDGIRVSPQIKGAVADTDRENAASPAMPLLINHLDNFTNMRMSGITTTNAYEGMTQTTGENSEYAATSLIGHVGSSSGTDIRLTFSDMKLDSRVNVDPATPVHNTYRSIFSHATFLESFQYNRPATCRGEYNFDKPTDDTKPYTLGKELSNTDSGQNPGKQYWFFNTAHEEGADDQYVCGSAANAASAYSNDHLRYVNHARDGLYYELDVNLAKVEVHGCGTYTDPYVITSAQQLYDIQTIINENGAVNDTPLYMDPVVLKNMLFNKESERDSAGKHGCVQYLRTNATGTNWKAQTEDKNVATNISPANVAKYLCNAYYLIKTSDGIIELDDNWGGLGTITNPFCGVIVGSGGAQIKITDTGTPSQYGGLVKFSRGSVIKDLTITYTDHAAVVSQGVPSTNKNTSFFGGVVGWCVGGDTIIDNVKVNYPDGGVSVTGTNHPHLTAVGGFVGLVGGGYEGNYIWKGGGVVFRNITAENGCLNKATFGETSTGETSTLANSTGPYFYVNPYVGRVLDGYAMSETGKIDNTDKNYQIPYIAPCPEGIKYLTRETETTVEEDGTETTTNKLTVYGKEGLWLLSAIANSGAACLDYQHKDNVNEAYRFGKSRTGTYDVASGSPSDKDKKDEAFLGNVDYGNKTTSYLIDRFTEGDIHNLWSAELEIKLDDRTDYDLSGYGNGFRGIGTSYGTLNSDQRARYRLLKIASFDGSGKAIRLAQNRKEYTEEKKNWTSIGTGLFVMLQAPDKGSFTASNFTLTGSTGISYYTGVSPSSIGDLSGNSRGGDRVNYVGAGMLAGNFAKVEATINVQNVALTNVTVNKDTEVGTTHAGGLFGLLWNSDNNYPYIKVELKDCTANGLSVTGRMDTGGLIGYSAAKEAVVTGTTSLSDVTLKSTQVTKTVLTGTGGLIGYAENCKVMIGGEGNPVTVNTLSICSQNNNTDSNHFNLGGVIGVIKAEKEVDAGSISNVSMQGTISIIGGQPDNSNSNAGGIIGSLYDSSGTAWNTSSTATHLKIEQIRIATEANSSMLIRNAKLIGGVIGVIKSSTWNDGLTETVLLRDIQVGRKAAAGLENPKWSVRLIASTEKDSSFVGGIVGDVGIAPIVAIDQIQIYNAAMLSHKRDGCSGVIVGLADGHRDDTPTKISMDNVLMEDCTVVVDDDSAHAGLLYGRLKTKAHQITGTNILAKNCTVGVSLTSDGSGKQNLYWGDGSLPTSAGGITVGLKKGNNAYQSYDALAKNGAYMEYKGNGNIGIWGGGFNNNASIKSVRLAGVCIQQEKNTLPMKDFGTDPSNTSIPSYIVRADFSGNQDGTHGSNPYVTTSPLSPLGTIPTTAEGSITISGDGASFGDDNTTPMAKTVLDDVLQTTVAGEKNLNWRYTKVTTQAVNLNDKSGMAYFGTFKKDGGNDNISASDFPALVLVANNSMNANELIYQWISVLTNRTVNAESNDVFINLTCYKWNGSEWTASSTDAETSPLRYNAVGGNKNFTLTRYYDSGNNSFTLVDVNFAPNGEGKASYHLYIPVIVQKLMPFQFWATALPGTSYTQEAYESQKSLAAVSHGEKATLLMSYSYLRSHAEWEDAVANGDDLMVSYDKKLFLQEGNLPVGTKLTLVDCANQAKYYTLEVQNDTIDENKRLAFSKFGREPVYLCDLLNLKESKGTTYVEVQGINDATLRVKTNTGDYMYFRPSVEGETGAYDIDIIWGDDSFISEEYYLTIETPSETSSVDNILFTSPKSLENPKLPTRRLDISRDHPCARYGSENRLLIGKFFTQFVSFNTEGSNEEISSENNTIHAEMEANITFNEEDLEGTLKSYARAQSLHQRFMLRMREETADNDDVAKNIVPGTWISARYLLNGEEVGKSSYIVGASVGAYPLEFPVSIPVKDLSVDPNAPTCLKVELELKFPDASILAQFPLVLESDVDTGVYLGAESYLAYSQETLSYTTIHTADWETTKRFYRTDFKAANLNYYPVDGHVEKVNQLGVNALDPRFGGGSIFTRATYNASALDTAVNADKIQCTLRLAQKTGLNSYKQVDWDTYLKNTHVEVSYGKIGSPGITKVQECVKVPDDGLVSNDPKYVVTFDLEAVNKEVPIDIGVNFDVLTGQAFQNANLHYANYRVLLEVDLLDAQGNGISGSNASDHIVYTNARINPNPIR